MSRRCRKEVNRYLKKNRRAKRLADNKARQRNKQVVVNRRNNKPGDYDHRAGWQDRHHIINKTNGGEASWWNLLKMDRHRHNAWHLLFNNDSFLDVIMLLLRVLRIKKHVDFGDAEEQIELEK